MACGILLPWPGIQPRSSAVKAQSPNHWNSLLFFYCFLIPQFWGFCLYPSLSTSLATYPLPLLQCTDIHMRTCTWCTQNATRYIPYFSLCCHTQSFCFVYIMGSYYKYFLAACFSHLTRPCGKSFKSTNTDWSVWSVTNHLFNHSPTDRH